MNIQPRERRPRILLVDDEEIIVQLMQRQLTRLNCEPVAAGSAQDALAQFQQGHADFDLIIADLFMPGMSGLELARVIHDLTPDLPILLCTGDDSTLAGHDLHQCGIVGVLRKPMTTVAFTEQVISALRSNSPTPTQ